MIYVSKYKVFALAALLAFVGVSTVQAEQHLTTQQMENVSANTTTSFVTQIKNVIVSIIDTIVSWIKNIIASLFGTKKVETKEVTLIKEISDPEILQSKEMFETFISSLNTYIVAKFTAPWCPACKLMVPTEQELAKKFEQQITFVKIDIEKAPALAQGYGIAGIPLYIYFKNGKELNRKIGGSHIVTFEKEIKKVFDIE